MTVLKIGTNQDLSNISDDLVSRFEGIWKSLTRNQKMMLVENQSVRTILSRTSIIENLVFHILKRQRLITRMENSLLYRTTRRNSNEFRIRRKISKLKILNQRSKIYRDELRKHCEKNSYNSVVLNLEKGGVRLLFVG